MVGFKVISTINEIELKKYPISSQTVLVGDLLEVLVGATTWTVCTSSSNFFSRKVIAYEAATSSGTEFLGYEVKGDEDVEVQVAATANSAHNGDRMLLTDKNTVNNTGTDNTSQNVCFIQDRPGSTTTSVIGKVVVGNGVDPDAT